MTRPPIILVGFCILSVFYHQSPAQKLGQLTSSKYDKFIVKDIGNYGRKQQGNRYKRFATITKTERGLVIVRKLLRGATQVNSRSKRLRKYEKEGTFKTARRQFNSLKPRNVVEDISSGYGKVYTGTVGDRRVILRERGLYSKQRPTIDIVELVPKTDQYIERIVYTNIKSQKMD